MGITFDLPEALLQPVVRRLLKDEAAEVSNFEILALKPGLGNPTSLGVYRVLGAAQTSNGEVPFSLVVKHLANGLPMMDASAPTNWNYWKREITFFESPLAGRIPKSIGYPEYLGFSDLADGTSLFWNGDLGDLTKSDWTWDACLTAAEVVAELNSIDCSDLENFNWLNRTQVEGWDAFRLEFNSFEPVFTPMAGLAAGDQELASAYAVYSPWMNKHEFIGQLLHGGRQTFVHGDFNLNNLVPLGHGEAKLIALDWQLAGVGRVGGEIASIYNTAIEKGVIGPEPELFEELCLVYTERFNKLNEDAPIELQDVRLAAAATGYFIVQGVGFFFTPLDANATEEENESRIRGLMNSFAAGPCMVYSRVLAELAPV
jgi:hypothetical protein